MQPQKAEAQSFFEFLAGLQHLVATWQRHMRPHAPHCTPGFVSPGILLRAIGTIEPPKD